MAKYNVLKAMGLMQELLEVIHEDDDHIPDPSEVRKGLDVLTGSSGLESVGFKLSPKVKEASGFLSNIFSFF